MLEMKVTDALGRTVESYTDARNRNRRTVQHAGGEDITVSYDYDPVNQVTAVYHPNGKTTSYKYDALGRKLTVIHPDAGETDMTYDAAGNLLTKLTAQLRKSISEKAPITYTYDYERLSEILYPENLFNRVTYTYGQPGDKYNRAGRLALVEDASGGEAYYYGRQGEVVKTVRTVMASVADIRTYVYGSAYDSWNRVRTMTYPDGEVVTYHYNAAGQVEGITSNKLGRESVIVDMIGYDKDGHTVYTKLGNGAEETYSYDNKRERLQETELRVGGNSVMANRYDYVADDTTSTEETFFYHSDHLGSTSYITDDKGNITQYDAYLPYGELLVDEHSSSEEMPYKFNGKEMDEETGLYYYGARYMNPVTSLWYGVDPLAEDYVDVSAYLYCHANPLILVDPNGCGDYYNISGKWLGTDGHKDGFVFIAESVTLDNNLVTNATNAVKLNISYYNFIRQSSTIYGESSAYRVRNKLKEPTDDLKKEMFAIASVHQRNKKAYGVSSEPAKDFREKTNGQRNKLPLMRTAIAAELNALTNGEDFSFGATMWDGAEQAQFPESEQRKSNGKFEIHMNTMGWKISPEHYKKWKENVGKSFKAPMIRRARNSFNGKPNMNAGKYRLKSTAVYGRTIFWKTN